MVRHTDLELWNQRGKILVWWIQTINLVLTGKTNLTRKQSVIFFCLIFSHMVPHLLKGYQRKNIFYLFFVRVQVFVTRASGSHLLWLQAGCSSLWQGSSVTRPQTERGRQALVVNKGINTCSTKVHDWQKAALIHHDDGAPLKEMEHPQWHLLFSRWFSVFHWKVFHF